MLASFEIISAARATRATFAPVRRRTILLLLVACSEPYSEAARAECAASDCDCDRDGFFDLDKPGCEASSGEKDCDDHDARVHPKQGWLELPGDWNCDGKLEKLLETNVSCSTFDLSCEGREGFDQDPACGEQGTYVKCKALTPTCKIGERSTRTQACR